MKRTYECMVLLDNRDVRTGWSDLKDKVGGMFAKHGAAVVSARLWEERRLAFPIRRQQRGTYLMVYFNSETEAVAGIRRDLELSESVMRHIVVACDTVPESAFEPEAVFDSAAVEIEEVSVRRVVSAAPERQEPDELPEPDEATKPEAAGHAKDRQRRDKVDKGARGARGARDEVDAVVAVDAVEVVDDVDDVGDTASEEEDR